MRYRASPLDVNVAALVITSVLLSATAARADRLATEAAWSFNTKG